ncbi:synaptotagmin-3-like [Gouania willdenowi]|nr:synaptotagmin-3-like [Gouania willdenowi]
MASSLLLLLLLCTASVSAQLRIFGLRARGLPSDLLGTTDGYVKVFIGTTILGQTSVRHNNANPWWDEEFAYFKVQENDLLRLEVHDDDFLFDDLLGVCQRPVKEGTHTHECYLEKKGTLFYTYTLSGDNQ